MSKPALWLAGRVEGMASTPEDPADRETDVRMTSLSSIAEPIAPPEEEGKLFFDLDQGDLVETSDRGVLFDCYDHTTANPRPHSKPPEHRTPDTMIQKNCQEVAVDEVAPMVFPGDSVSPRSYYNSFSQMDLRQEWARGSRIPQTPDALRTPHPEYAVSWKPQIRIAPQERQQNYPPIRQDVQIKQGKQHIIEIMF